MITKDEFENMCVINAAPYLEKIDTALRVRNMCINLGDIPKEGVADLRATISHAMIKAGWKVAFVVSSCRDDAGDLYIRLS